MEWIMSHIVDIVLILAVAAVVVLIIIKAVKDKKVGKNSCGCSCADCAMGDQCAKIGRHRKVV